MPIECPRAAHVTFMMTKFSWILVSFKFVGRSSDFKMEKVWSSIHVAPSDKSRRCRETHINVINTILTAVRTANTIVAVCMRQVKFFAPSFVSRGPTQFSNRKRRATQNVALLMHLTFEMYVKQLLAYRHSTLELITWSGNLSQLNSTLY
jgi:hypothetical protein